MIPVDESRFRGTLATETVDRFRREAETLAKLDDNVGIVGVVDYDTEPFPWIAMEYMNGGDLRARPDDDPPASGRRWMRSC